LDKEMLKNVDQSVYKLFPDYKGTEWIDKKYEINVRHLLSMTAGIEWDENRDTTDPRQLGLFWGTFTISAKCEGAR